MKEDKPTKKKQNYNEEILETLNGKYGYTIDYIRKCIRGDRKGVMADEIIKDYNALIKASKAAIIKASKIK